MEERAALAGAGLPLAFLALALFLAPGAAALGGVPSVTLSAPGTGPLLAEDLTGDGAADLLAVIDGGSLALWAGPIVGEPLATWAVPGASAVAAGDLDGDGRRDVAVLGEGGVHFFRQEVGGLSPRGQISESASGLLLADLNADGRADLVTWDATALLIHFSIGGFAFSAASPINEGGDDVAAGDLNGDGLVELVVASPDRLVIHHFDASGQIRFSETATLGGTYAAARLLVADADADGLPEIALLRQGSAGSALTLHPGNPEGRLGGAAVGLDDPFQGEMLLADLDDDGVKDLAAVLAEGSVRVHTLTATAEGFAVAAVLDVPYRGAGTLRFLAAADLDGDGHRDLAVRAKGSVYLYPQGDTPASFLGDLPSPIHLAQGDTATIDLGPHFADDHSPLAYRVVGDAATDLGFEIRGQTLHVSVPLGWSGEAVVTVEAWDGVFGHDWTPSNPLRIFVNDPPHFASVPPSRGQVGDPYTYFVRVTDHFPEDDVTRLTVVQGPSGMAIDGPSGRLGWTPTEPGDYQVTLVARDGYGGVATQTFTVTVAAAPTGLAVEGGYDLMTAGGAALLAILAAWTAANENARFSAGLLFAPLYTKLKREEILQHFVRGQIYGYILANPGEHYNAIRTALGLTNGCLAHHLRTLERESFIKSRKFGLYRRFYPVNMRIPEDGEYVNEVRRTILGIIRGRPGISQVEIAHSLNLTPPTVSYHLGILSKANRVKVVRKGRRTHCFAV